MNNSGKFSGSYYFFEDKENFTLAQQLMLVVFCLVSFLALFISVRKPFYIPVIYPALLFIVFLSYVFNSAVVSGAFNLFFTIVSLLGILVSSSVVNKIFMLLTISLCWILYLILTKYQDEMISLVGGFKEKEEKNENALADVRLAIDEVRRKSLAADQLSTNYKRMVTFLNKSVSGIFAGAESFFKGLSSSDYFGEDVHLEFLPSEEILSRADWMPDISGISDGDTDFFVSTDSRRIFARFISCDMFSCYSQKVWQDPFTSGYRSYEWMLFEKKSGIFSDDDRRFISTAVDFARAAATNVMLYEKTQQLSIIDGLTGLFLRGYFLERFEEEFALASSHKLPLSVMMIDLDDFKKLNDRYGHPAGDEALRMVAHILKNRLRETDIVGRYGGEEFVVAMPHTSLRDAVLTAEEIRRAIAHEKFFVGDGSNSAVGMSDKALSDRYAVITASIGVAERGADANCSPDGLISAADRKLYEAKNSGKNRVVG